MTHAKPPSGTGALPRTKRTTRLVRRAGPCALALALVLLATAFGSRHASTAANLSAPAAPFAVDVAVADAVIGSTPPGAAADSAPAGTPPDELVRWVDAAPADASLWLSRQAPAPALDSALAALATHPEVLVPRPAFAADQAGRIADAGLRLAALSEVLSTWARFDPDAARLRLAKLDRIDDLERSHLQELLADASASP